MKDHTSKSHIVDRGKRPVFFQSLFTPSPARKILFSFYSCASENGLYHELSSAFQNRFLFYLFFKFEKEGKNKLLTEDSQRVVPEEDVDDGDLEDEVDDVQHLLL